MSKIANLCYGALTLVTPNTRFPLVWGFRAHQRNQELILSIAVNVNTHDVMGRAKVSIIEGTEVVQDSASPFKPGLEECRLDGQFRVRQGVGCHNIAMETLGEKIRSGCRLLGMRQDTD